ncbi:uncharacterized protein LOC135824880 [Sycon ciliatum]|uniref:uncharacterized protein LOC135824880 n=1 Tax=Sycon ciliatum TaxID=27933 RepID=UPI0031F6B57C
MEMIKFALGAILLLTVTSGSAAAPQPALKLTADRVLAPQPSALEVAGDRIRAGASTADVFEPLLSALGLKTPERATPRPTTEENWALLLKGYGKVLCSKAIRGIRFTCSVPPLREIYFNHGCDYWMEMKKERCGTS